MEALLMENNYVGFLIDVLLVKEGFNPKNWDIKESPIDNLYTIKNLDDSVEFRIFFEYNESGDFPDTTYLYTEYLDDGTVEDAEANSIKECIELGQAPKEEYHTGWNGKETLLGEVYRENW